MSKLISYTQWHDYGKGRMRIMRARYPKSEYALISKREYKTYTTYYLKPKLK